MVYAPLHIGWVFCTTSFASAVSVHSSIIEIERSNRILQNLRRREVCRLRIAFGAVGDPTCVLLMFVIQLENVTWFSAFVAANCRSRLTLASRRKVRTIEVLRLNWPGPVIAPLRALPHCPASGAV